MKALLITLACLFSVSAFANGSLQKSACLPNTAEAKNWPVSVIYMHGLFEPNGEGSTPFRGLERTNRSLLSHLASEKHIRIAVPLAPARGKWRSWNGLSLATVEKMAKSACGNSPLIEGRDLIGFSNGAIISQKYTCAQTKSYSHVFSIGAHPYETGGGTKSCGTGESRFKASTPHDFSLGLRKFEPLIQENKASGNPPAHTSDTAR